ncbi:MAG: InlB B-repeat-containing protein, partial [Clostridia bacterium]|nr:InlB B-repeat-containing protein [Clostridia bacterium]
NIGDAGKALPKVPAKSIDSLDVEYSITLPSDYICRNIDKNITLNSKNCLDALAQAIKKGVYEAAEKGELSAYSGFDAEWRSLNEEAKQKKAEEYAACLADALVFACSYTEANDKNFASDVKSAYQTFTKWLSGSDSLTSPLVAQLKMLSLTHAFEYEVIDQVNDIGYSLCTMNMSYYSFVQTVLSMSKSFGEKANKDVNDMYENAEKAMTVDYLNFVTGNPNFCYMAECVLEYKPVTVESTITFIYDEPQNPEYVGQVVNYDGHESRSAWQLFEKGKNKESDSVKSQSRSELLGKTICTRQARLVCVMYKSNGCIGSFGDYLVKNKVAADADSVTKNIITSFNTIGLDLGIDTDLICHYAAGVAEYGHHDYANGKVYAVPGGVKGRLDDNDNYHIKDKTIGGVFNTVTGKSDENGTIACRAFYGDELKIYAFSDTDCSFTRERLSRDKIDELHLEERNMSNTLYTATDTFSSEHGMLVSAEPNTYTFPASTKSIPDNFFGSASKFEKLVFDGTPETIADNAFSGVGTPAKRCFIKAPFTTGSLVGAWHGGYFGNTNITVEKNDGSGETETVVAVTGAPTSSVVCTFTASEHATFEGWSFYPNGVVANPNETIFNGATLYAKWKYDHEHDFEVTKEAVAATCTEAGVTQEKTCKTCGYKDVQIIPATGHTCTYKESGSNYIAKCAACDYEETLYPKDIGYHTVWSENKSDDDVKYTSYMSDGTSGGITYINKDGVYVIKTKTPPYAFLDYSQQTIEVKDGVNASVCLAGVNVTGSIVGIPGINIGKAGIHLTLNGENTVTSYFSDPFDCEGNLTVDCTGSLILTTDAKHMPINCTGEKTVINGGCINADGGFDFSVKIIDDKTNGKLVITRNASVKTSHGIDTVPVNENGEKVYLLKIPNRNFYTITVDGNELPDWVTIKDERNAYIYITAGEHEILVGGQTFEFNPFEDEPVCLEKQCGDLIVTNPTGAPNAVSYINTGDIDILTIRKSVPITIKNADPDKATHTNIYIQPDVDADITLAGVNIDLSSFYGASPIQNSAGSYTAGDTKITLAEGTENIIRGGGAGIATEGVGGSLTIDGEGTLTVTGSRVAAAIGSNVNKPVNNITINGGIIYASVENSQAAAIGSGYIQTGVSIDTGCAVNNITINGGKVYASSDKAPAVGAGVCEQDLPVNTITINGGMLIANSNSSEYAVGSAKTNNTVVNGGIVTAESIGGSKIVIENTASVKTNNVSKPVNGKGKSVFLNEIPITVGDQLVIDGKGYRCIGHNGENKIYLYLTNPDEIKKIHGITLEKSEGGNVYYSPAVPLRGETVTLSATAEEGYALVDYEITPDVDIKDGTFTMPEKNVTVKGIFAKVSTVTLTESEHGKVLPSKSIVPAGEKVSLYAMPDDGYELDTVTLTPSCITDGKYAFTMPEEDVTISCTFKPKKHTLTWNIDGEKTVTELPFGSKITAPENPEKDGCNFTGWTPSIPDTMPDGDMEFTAEFEAITYKAKFKADGKEIAAVDYTINMTKLDEPAVPEKLGYIGRWEAYTLTTGGITVNAQYVPEIFKAIFVADGEVVKNVEYTVETLEITEPAVPEKEGFTGRWSAYDLRIGGITVKAVYTAEAVHQHTFETKYCRNEAAHWFASTCGHNVAASLAPHTFGEGIVNGNSTIYICSECGYVKTVTDAQAGTSRELEKSVNAAKEAIDKAAMGGDGEVKEYAETAKAELEKQTDPVSVTEKLAAALEKINAVKTGKAIDEAIAHLNNIAGGSSSSKAKSAARQANAAMKQAQNPEEVNAILADALTQIEDAEREIGVTCPNCGKVHGDSFRDKINCFLSKLYKFINDFIKKFSENVLH